MSLIRTIRQQLGLMSGGNESQNHFWDGSVANALTLKRGVPDAPGATVMSVVDGNVAFPNTPGFSFRNKLINGGFDIWQRGTSFSANGYTADRWVVGSGNATWSVIKYEDVVYGKHLNVSIATATPGSGSFDLSQRIEDVRTLHGKKATLTIDYGGNSLTANKIGIQTVQNFGTGGSAEVYSTPVFITIGGSNNITLDIPSVSGKTIGANSYLSIRLLLSNYTLPEINGQTGAISINYVQLEEGSIATPFEQRPIALELSLCQRYYETGKFFYAGYNLVSEPIGGNFYFAPKRIAPSVSTSNNQLSNCDQLNVYNAYTSGAFASAVGTVTSRMSMAFDWSASAEL